MEDERQNFSQNMKLTAIQLAAILKAGKTMVLADGKIEPEEMVVLTHELRNFNVPEQDVPKLLELGDSMSYTAMLATLNGLDIHTQKYVAGYLATIMVCDGDIDDNEMKLWQLTCTLAGFPIMNLKEALNYWANN